MAKLAHVVTMRPSSLPRPSARERHCLTQVQLSCQGVSASALILITSRPLSSDSSTSVDVYHSLITDSTCDMAFQHKWS